jgi:hypothetical protein
MSSVLELAFLNCGRIKEMTGFELFTFAGSTSNFALLGCATLMAANIAFLLFSCAKYCPPTVWSKICPSGVIKSTELNIALFCSSSWCGSVKLAWPIVAEITNNLPRANIKFEKAESA